MSEPIEGDGDRNEDEGHATEEGASPVYFQRRKHVRRKQGKDGTCERAEKCVGCDGRGSTVNDGEPNFVVKRRLG